MKKTDNSPVQKIRKVAERSLVRSKRKGARPKTRLAKRLSKEERRQSLLLEPWMHEDLPKTRAECKYGERPCPYVRCRYHLALEVKPNGSLSENFHEIVEMRETCVLDVAERGENTLEYIGECMNITRERVRQLETDALQKLRESDIDMREFVDFIGSAGPQMESYMDYIKYGN
ncbi:DNA-binding protein [Myxococcota bacterium]|nr:DNA-binding protein [Myxococcota bacterium]